jgi:hypothetical protein
MIDESRSGREPQDGGQDALAHTVEAVGLHRPIDGQTRHDKGGQQNPDS